MRKALRITDQVLLGIIALMLVVIAVSYPISAMKFGKRYDIKSTFVAVPADSVTLARARPMAVLRGCTSCHTESLAGQVMIDGFPFARLAAVNLTRGKGGIGATYSDSDWDRAIRHGVKPNGEQLMIMPSNEYNAIRDENPRCAHILTSGAPLPVASAVDCLPTCRRLTTQCSVPLTAQPSR